jgi:hypothetical protein
VAALLPSLGLMCDSVACFMANQAAAAQPAAVTSLFAEPTEKPRELISRELDFWLLGGASIVVWALAFFLERFRKGAWSVDHHFQNIIALTSSLALLANHPHFLASYRLAYGQGFRFVRRFWFQLVVVPLILCAVFAYAYRGMSAPGMPGRKLMGWMVTTMYFTVGWHYAKQAFGAVMVQAKYDGYRYALWQRRLLKLALFSIWWVYYSRNNATRKFFDFHGFSYGTLGLTQTVATVAYVVHILATLGLIGVFLHNYVVEHRKPSANMLIPIISMYIWWSPIFFQRDFYQYLVPLFHSLQYLTFVKRVESQKAGGEKGQLRGFRMSAIFLGLVVAGFCAFELIPNTLDTKLGLQKMWHAFFFYAAFHVFINIHHYFIDNVLWRFNNDLVKKYLV